MIRLLRMSHHELMYRWLKDEYVARPKEGQFSAIEIFTELLRKLDEDKAQLIRSNLLFPTGKDVQEIIDAHESAVPVLRFSSYDGDDRFIRSILLGPAEGKKLSFAAVQGLLNTMMDIRNNDDHPYVAEVFVNLEN